MLTLLLGLLGSSVHVIRDVNRRLDDFTLTRVQQLGCRHCGESQRT